MLHLCAKLGYGFASAKKYLIKQSAYLIQAPPTKPLSSNLAYFSEIVKGKKGLKVSEEIKKASENWKNLSPEARSTYESAYKSRLEEYLKQKDAYHQKYVAPFQYLTPRAAAVSHIFATKQINLPKDAPIQEYGRQVTELLKKLTPQQQAQFKKQVEKKNAEKKQLARQFMFPQRLYTSQNSFSRNHSKLYVQQRKNAYQAYVKAWQADVEAWLIKNKIQMKLSDFKRLYNRDLKKKKAKTEKTTEENPGKSTTTEAAASNK